MNFRSFLLTPLVLFAWLLPCGHAADDVALDAGKNQWKRTPELLIPFVEQPPAIDGTVDRSEWLQAAGLGPLKTGTDGVTDALNRRVWICHDGTTIYLGFQFQRPKGTAQPSLPRDEKQIAGEAGELIDAAEAMFAPRLNFNEVFDFWVYGNSASGQAKCSRDRDPAWKGDWKRSARLTEDGWEGEMAIPFATFGLKQAPDSDEWWGFDFADSRATPFRFHAHWSYRGKNWQTYENFGRVRFGRTPAVRLVRAGETSDGRTGLEFAAVNSGKTPETLKFSIDLLQRTPDGNSASKSYFENIDSGVSHDAQAEFTKDATLEQMIAFAERSYTLSKDLSSGEEVIPPGQRKTFGLAADLPFGEYLGRYRILDAGGAVLAAGTTTFKRERPLELRFEPYWLYSELVDVFADLGALASGGPGVLEVNLLPAEGGAPPLKTATSKWGTSSSECVATLDVHGVKPGYYRIQAVLRDAAGKEIARNVQPVERPEFPVWFKNDIGNRTEVPEPWTPIKATPAGKVSVWGRTYDLGKVLPVSATSGGDEVLQAPVSLQTQTSQGKVDWKVETLSLESQGPGQALYKVALQGVGLRLAGTIRVEFDGLIWYDLTLEPTKGPVKIESMVLDIPVVQKFSELMGRHKFLADPVWFPKGEVPKADLNGAPGLLEDSRFPFTPYVWIGDERAGMGFTAEAPVDWSIDAPKRLLETRASTNGGPGRILAHIIQAPKMLDKPMRLQFGLQATPIRPAPDDHQILNIYQRNAPFDDEKEYQELVKRGCKVVVYYYDWRGNSETELGGTPERPVTAEAREKLKRSITMAHKYGLKVIMYSGWGVNAVSPNWKKYGFELGEYPVANKGWGAYGQSAGQNGAYADFMAWGHADLAKEYGADGVLWDSAANLHADTNLRIGNAWIDDQGRVRPKYAVLATRDLYRRIYNVYKSEVGKDGIIYNHAGSLWPVNVFADIHNRGEGRPMRAKTLRESWVPFEEFRSEYSAEPFGTLYSGEINDWEKLPMRTSTHSAVTLLHGTYAKEYALLGAHRYRSYDFEARPLFAFWKTFDWLPMNGTETRFYYYQNLKGKYQAVKAEPASLLSSAFVSVDKKRAMIVVSNLDTTPVAGARIVLDPAALGLLPANPLKVEDGVTLEPIAIKGNVITIDIDQQRYRLLKVFVE